MKILLVIDQFYDANNGMTISARRFAEVLKSHGHVVHVVSNPPKNEAERLPTEYYMNKQYIPIFDNLVSSQGMTFAKPNDEILRNAIKWADVIHILVPFALSRHAIEIASELHKPYTAAFHVQPENVTSSINMGKIGFINTGIYKWFNHYIYKYCNHIHCPSKFIANELKRTGYTAKLHVISNGIDPDFVYRKIPKSKKYAGKFLILMIGRMSVEKRQDVLINAVAKSKHADKIQLILAGQGPKKEAYFKLAKKLPNPIEINFFPKPKLLDLIAMSDLYVHASDMEIEAMSCMEAFASGLVPIIANSDKSATPQFALDERSLFEAGNSDDLAKKIDYWIEHEFERKKMEYEYSELGKKYNLEECVYRAEEMFRDAIEENERVDHNGKN